MELTRSDKLLLKLCYYFMLADGNISEEESANFNDLCSHVWISPKEQASLCENCKNAIRNISDDNYAEIIALISVLLAEDSRAAALEQSLAVNDDKIAQAKIVQTLITLGFTDKGLSEPEEKIINFLLDYWKFDYKLYQELLDIAETTLALTKQKEWIKSIDKSYDEKTMLIRIIDERIADLSLDVYGIISEADMYGGK